MPISPRPPRHDDRKEQSDGNLPDWIYQFTSLPRFEGLMDEPKEPSPDAEPADVTVAVSSLPCPPRKVTSRPVA